jgi:hypothetical protein
MARRTVVLAFFRDEADADDAVEQMKAWDKWDDDVKLNAIGVLALDDKGKLKTHKLGNGAWAKRQDRPRPRRDRTPTLLAGVVGGGLLAPSIAEPRHEGRGSRPDRAQLTDGRPLSASSSTGPGLRCRASRQLGGDLRPTGHRRGRGGSGGRARVGQPKRKQAMT